MANILIVEDEAEICELVAEYLGAMDHKVRCAADFEKAMESILEEEPDLVLLDIRLKSQRSGLELLQVIRIRKPEVQVYMLSASCDDATVARAMTLGAHGYIMKPFTLEDVGSLVSRKLESLSLLGRY